MIESLVPTAFELISLTQADKVAPVVKMSSTSNMCLLSNFEASSTEKAPATFARRCSPLR